MDCVAEDRRLIDIAGDWSTAALDPEVWYSRVRQGREKSVRTPAEEERSGQG